MSMVSLTVNGRELSADVEPRTHLADLLRETHNLTGTHIGCEHGVCGACTILVDGVPTRSCITYAVTCEKAEITTIEGLDEDEIAAELRAAFQREHGLQCGYCTPGMIVSARDIVLRMEAPSEHDIRIAMSGNLCRCTGYVGIVRAVESVVAARRARGIAAVPDGGRKRLGPAGSGNAAPTTAAAPAARAEQVAERASRPASSAAATRANADWKPKASFQQSFAVSHPIDEVWTFFGRIEEVAACLPGASLAGPPQDGPDGSRVDGRMRVKVGPIAAEFQGVADVMRDDATRSGTIIGSGRDARSNSATRGAIRYALRPGDNPGETRVDVDVGYTLTGMLAQFSRSGLVQDVANRLTAAFVQNLEARLAGAAAGEGGARPPAPVQELNALSLIAGIVTERVKRLLAKVLRRS
jgi:carbon-monoxide dehydrogenase small subunit